MLFYPWQNESVDLIAGSNSYEDTYKKKQKQIEVVHKEYIPYSDVLEEAIENAEVHERENENINDDEQVNTVSNMDKYATGMVAFHIKGTTEHSGLHIPIHQNKLSNLSHSERNNLYKQYGDVKVVFIDEISVVGCRIFNKIDQCLQEIFGCKKVFGGHHVVAIGDFYHMKPIKDTTYLKIQIVVILHLKQILGQITLKSSHW